MGFADSRPYVRWLLLALIVAGGFFGLAPFIAPTQFAKATGFIGTDTFMYRLAGAASFGYAMGFAAGFRSDWDALRIPIVSTMVFNAASIVACLHSIVVGDAQPVVYVILAASIVFTAATIYLLRTARLDATREAPAATDGGDELAPWVFALFAVGTLAAAFFGIVALVAADTFGRAVGYSGTDEFVYRQGGAATLGAAVGGLLVLQSRRWHAARLPAIMAVTFNVLSVIAAAIDIASGGQPIAWIILVAAGAVSIGMVLALIRDGR